MKKRLLAIFCALLLTLSCGIAAFADGNGSVNVLGTNVRDGNKTTYWKCTDSKLTASDETDYNVKFEFSDNKGTLTLKDLSGQYSNGSYIETQSSFPLEIVLVGTNDFTPKSGYSIDAGITNKNVSYGGTNGAITFSGTGSLDMTVTSCGVRSTNGSTDNKNGDVIVDSGSITITSNGSGDVYGFRSKNYTQNGGSVTLNTGAGSTTGGGTVAINVDTTNGAININDGDLKVNMKTECANTNAITALKGKSITFGTKASAEISIVSNRTSVQLMSVTPTISNDAVYSANADGSSSTTLLKTADETARAVLKNTKPLRYFSTDGTPKYTVTYTDGVNDAVVFADKTYTVKQGTAMPAYGETDPTRTGYRFDGWDPAYVAADTVTANKTYTAKWVKVWNIKYTDGVASTDIFVDQDHVVDNGAKIPAFDGKDFEGGVPTRTGYEFKGWDPAYVATATALADVTYTAQWEELYTVTYKDGDGSQVLFEDKVYPGLHNGDPTPAFSDDGSDPIRESYVFKGWSPTVTSTVTGNVTYTALWEEIKTTDEVQVFNQPLSLANVPENTDYVTYWKAVTPEGEKTKLYPATDTDYNVKLEYNGTDESYTLTLNNLQTENAYPASPVQSYIVLKTDKPLELVLQGTNKLGYKSSEQIIYNAISCNGKNVGGNTVVGDLTISGTGSLDATCYRTGIESHNGEGNITVKGGTVKLHVIGNNSGAEGIHCNSYTQTDGSVYLDVQDAGSGAVANSTGFVGQVTEPLHLGNFEQTGGILQVKVKTAAQAFGVIGFEQVHLGDQADMEIILDNFRTDGSDNWTRLFGMGDDNAEQVCTLIIDGKSVYGKLTNDSVTEDLSVGASTDILQKLGTAEDNDKLHYFHQGKMYFTVTYTDNVEGMNIFADQVYSHLSKYSDTPAFVGDTPVRMGYHFGGFLDADGNPVAPTVTKDVTYYAQWIKNAVPHQPTGRTVSPKTADTSNMNLWFVLLAVSSAGLGVYLVGNKRRIVK